MTNIRLAMRTSDWAVEARFATDPDRPDLVVEVTTGDLLPPTLDEAGQYAVINGCRPRRAQPTTTADAVCALTAAPWCTGVELRPVTCRGGQTELLVLTSDDSRADRVRAGAAVQSVCLTATAMRLIVRPPVNLLRDLTMRAGLIERLALAGYPQASLRVDMTSAL